LTLIPPDYRWKVVNLNPTPPTIGGLVKIHKQEHPIRPIVNWTNAPAYKLAPLLIQKCTSYIPLPYVYNIKNPVHLINDLNEISVDQDLKFVRIIWYKQYVLQHPHN
jgi:hypothetical protein